MVRWLWQSTMAGTIVAPPASITSAPFVSAESFGRIHAIFPSSIARLTPVRSDAAVPSANAASWRTVRGTAGWYGEPLALMSGTWPGDDPRGGGRMGTHAIEIAGCGADHLPVRATRSTP